MLWCKNIGTQAANLWSKSASVRPSQVDEPVRWFQVVFILVKKIRVFWLLWPAIGFGANPGNVLFQQRDTKSNDKVPEAVIQ